jgi:hypothetical protein
MHRLAAYWSEYQTTPWLAPPPSALTTRLQGEFLRRVASDLYQAYQKFDLPRTQQLRDHWNQLSPDEVLPMYHPVRDRADLALDWLRREEGRQVRRLAFDSALADLEQALAGPTPLNRLRELWSKVREFNMTVPSKLDELYTERIGALRKEADWRERLILVATFAIGAVVLVGFLLFAMLRSR